MQGGQRVTHIIEKGGAIYMAKRKEITVRCFISIGGADYVPLESLTDEEREAASKTMTANFAKAMEDYYRRHQEEYATLPSLEGEDENTVHI